jgi:lysophospholipase L1-like esterase
LADPSHNLTWRPAADPRFFMRGLAWWAKNRGRFCRLPLKAQNQVRQPVWNLAQCPAGAHLAFRTNATAFGVRVRNSTAEHMNHMASTGSNGLMLYGGGPGQQRPWSVARPSPSEPKFDALFFSGLEKKMREFRLYLPLYTPLLELDIGLSRGARLLAPTAPVLQKPAVFYGTSITQGGCASTAGSDYVSTVGRQLNLETVNLGFSGNGRGEPEMARLLAEIDASIYVIDYAANVDAARLKYTLPRLVGTLRRAHPSTPILLMTPLCYSQYDFSPNTRRALEDKRDITLAYYVNCRQRGDSAVHLADGFSLLPFGADAAYVDGVHPTDAGFERIAHNLAPAIERILLRND